MTKHARRTGWRIELGGGYDLFIDGDEAFVQAKTFSASRHTDVMSLHVELCPPPRDEGAGIPSVSGTGIVHVTPSETRVEANVHTPMKNESTGTASGEIHGRNTRRGIRPLVNRLAAEGIAEEEFERKARWGGVNSHLENLHFAAYRGSSVTERATAYQGVPRGLSKILL